MKKIFAALIAGAFVLAGVPAGAATSTSGNINEAVPDFPPEALDLFNSLKKIKLGSDKVKAPTNSSSTVQNIEGQIRNGWNKLNNWFEGTIGISLRGIIRALGYIVIWILLLLIRIVRWILGLI